MKDKIIAITGGGGGLGACLARKYAAEGAKVVLLDISENNLKKVAGELPGKSYIYPVDISSKKQVHETFTTISEEVGDIDTLINCAGIGKFDLAETFDEKDVNGMIDINCKGTIYCIQEVIGPMKKRNDGAIINVVSMSGIRPVATESVYCASKYGIMGFTKALALELEKTQVRTTAICMGNMATDLWKGSRSDEMDQFIDPEDMADLIIENTRLRKNLMVEEIHVKNLRP